MFLFLTLYFYSLFFFLIKLRQSLLHALEVRLTTCRQLKDC